MVSHIDVEYAEQLHLNVLLKLVSCVNSADNNENNDRVKVDPQEVLALMV